VTETSRAANISPNEVPTDVEYENLKSPDSENHRFILRKFGKTN
jgi:hypothetical protein